MRRIGHGVLSSRTNFLNMQNTGEIIVYRPDETDIHIPVRVDKETVWLNRHQLSILFQRDVKTIGKHIAKALTEELHMLPVVAKFATTATDGKSYQVEHYNLDVVISVGYRVKSAKGVQFRIWANRVLKEHLLQGYSISRRFDGIDHDLSQIHGRVRKIEIQLKTDLPAKQGVFFNGQVYDAYAFVSQLIKSALSSITLIDNYIDETVLTMLTKRKGHVHATIYTRGVNRQLQLDINKHNRQYPPISIITFTESHDRFLIIDQNELYHLGASLKDLGKKWFAFSKLDLPVEVILSRLPE